MSNVVLKVENLWKQYRLGVVGTGTLSHDLARWWALARGKEDPTAKIGARNQLDQVDSEYVWALKDINFEVKQGEVLGIIGKNGAGKSTLLKILSKVTGPTKGKIKVKGRIASLLEVGTGFHPELTGRENIFLNGAILGMKKWEIRKKLDEIIEFAGVAKYADTPVKRYSSGMYVRLAFAVAAHLDPEILVVDEVLAVGDADFQKKALGKMQDISRNDGRTVLFVSHNMASMERLCVRGLLLEQGVITRSDSISECVKAYLNLTDVGNEEFSLSDERYVEGARYFSRFIDLHFENSLGHVTKTFVMGESVKVVIDFEIINDINNIEVGFKIVTPNDIKLCTYLSSWERGLDSLKKGRFRISCAIPYMNLFPGEYGITPWIRQQKSGVDIQVQNAKRFQVTWANITGKQPLFEGTGHLGTFQRSEWKMDILP